MRGQKWRVTGPFALVLLLLISSQSLWLVGAILLAVGAHELGHLLAICLQGGRVERFALGVGGMNISYHCPQNTYRKEALVALAGPLANFLTCLLAIVLVRAFRWESLYLFCGCSVLLGAFNLLPALPLDGGVCLRALLLCRWEPHRVDTLVVWDGVLVGSGLLVGGISLCIATRGNITLLCCGLMILQQVAENFFTPGGKSLIV